MGTKKFINICKMVQTDLKAYLNKELSKYYKNVISKDGFIYAKGKDKICLTAHMDTVHKEPVKDVVIGKEDGKHIVSSPQGIGGDDRCGIYMILKILEAGLRPTIIFCEDEEIGCVGSSKFTDTKFINSLEKMYFLIELDRRGFGNIVFYDDANKDFHDFVSDVTGYEEETGSYSDICELSPACGISSVNIGCGYYKAHTTNEYVIMEEMESTIKAVIKLMKQGLKNKVRYEYIENKISPFYSSKYSDYYDDWYDMPSTTKYITGYISYDNGYGDKGEEEIEGFSVEEVFYNFFVKHQDISFSQITDYYLYDENYNSVTPLLNVI